MVKPHKTIQAQGKRASSAAQIASNTVGTYGGASSTQSNTADARIGGGDSRDYAVISASPASSSNNGELDKTPITLGHLFKGAKILWPALAILACGLWWLSHLSIKVDQHEDDIKDVKVKTDKLINDSTSESAKLQKLDSQVGRLEDKMYEQAMGRSKK